ncbi:MAG: TonB family protein [bacterium]
MTLHQLWDFLVPEEKRPLGWLIFFALLAHVSAFFLFKSETSYLKPVQTFQPRVMLMRSVETSVGGMTSGWVDLLDPSMIALPLAQLADEGFKKDVSRLQKIWPVKFPSSLLVPASVQTAHLFVTLGELTKRAAASISLPRAKPMPVPIETPPPLSGTAVQFFGGLTKREAVKREPLPQPESPLALRPSVLRLAVDEQGVVAHVFLDESSGDSAIDLQAVKNLRNWRFAPLTKKTEPTADKLQWGRATVFWDIQSPSKGPIAP